MIDWLEIRNFAIADHVELELSPGFTAVTGETGSGKSIMVDAVAILLGHRSDASFIRHGKDSAELQAGLAITDNHPARDWLRQQELDADSGELILRRLLRRDKPSRGFINGLAATATQLRELGQLLVEIHGQNEHHSLTQKRKQLELLDNLAENSEQVEQLSSLYENIRNVRSQIQNFLDEGQSTQERVDLLKFQLQELAELDPVEGEWEELESRHRKLHHLQEIGEGTAEISGLLGEGEDSSVLARLDQSLSRLHQLEKFDDSLGEIAKMLEEARIVIDEATDQLAPYYRDGDFDEQQVRELEQRFSQYHNLARKHRIQPQELPTRLQQMQQELDGLSDPEGEIKRLEDALEWETGQYDRIAQALGKSRKQHARRVSREVTTLMQGLGMEGGKFEITLNPVEKGEITRYGGESAEFMVSANPGVPMQPVSKVASGGELSRISLAIQVVLASKTRAPSLIFDEVDVGIGGAVAHIVGEKLRALGDHTQVLCVTHLPQVAARAHQQYSVSKDSGGTRVSALDNDERVREIARMSGGDKITENSLAHAEELLRTA